MKTKEELLAHLKDGFNVVSGSEMADIFGAGNLNRDHIKQWLEQSRLRLEARESATTGDGPLRPFQLIGLPDDPRDISWPILNLCNGFGSG
jgi:hypothetical protein